MNRLTLKSVFFIIAFLFSLRSQADPLLRTYHGPWGDWWTSTTVNDMISVSGGGFLITGTSNGYGVVIKSNAQGELEWSKLFKGGGIYRDTTLVSAVETHDGGFAVVGSANVDEGLGGWDIFLARLSSEGSLQWEKVYGRNNSVDSDLHGVYDYGQRVYEVSDSGGYKLIVTGTAVYSHTPHCVYHGYVSGQVLKLNSDGAIFSDFMVAGHSTEHVYMTPDGGILAGMSTYWGAPYNQYSMTLQKYDSSGGMLWTKVYFAQTASSYDGLGSAFVEPLSEGFLVASKTNSGKLFNFKIDNSGNPVRQTLIDVYTPSSGVWIDKNRATFDYGNIVSVNSGYTSADDVLIKFNSDGNVDWSQYYIKSGVGGPDINAVVQVGDGYAATADGYDFVLAFLGSAGTLGAVCTALPVRDISVKVESFLGTASSIGADASVCNTYISAASEKTISLVDAGVYHEVSSCPVSASPTPTQTPTVSPTQTPSATPTVAPQNEAQSLIIKARYYITTAKKAIPTPPARNASAKVKQKYKAIKAKITAARDNLLATMTELLSLAQTNSVAINTTYPHLRAAYISKARTALKKAISRRTSASLAAKEWKEVQKFLKTALT